MITCCPLNIQLVYSKIDFKILYFHQFSIVYIGIRFPPRARWSISDWKYGDIMRVWITCLIIHFCILLQTIGHVPLYLDCLANTISESIPKLVLANSLFDTILKLVLVSTILDSVPKQVSWFFFTLLLNRCPGLGKCCIWLFLNQCPSYGKHCIWLHFKQVSQFWVTILFDCIIYCCLVLVSIDF